MYLVNDTSAQHSVPKEHRNNVQDAGDCPALMRSPFGDYSWAGRSHTPRSWDRRGRSGLLPRPICGTYGKHFLVVDDRRECQDTGFEFFLWRLGAIHARPSATLRRRKPLARKNRRYSNDNTKHSVSTGFHCEFRIAAHRIVGYWSRLPNQNQATRRLRKHNESLFSTLSSGWRSRFCHGDRYRSISNLWWAYSRSNYCQPCL